jgi:dephospho-CoA kinase
MAKKLKIGITGGIGSGKSSVSNFLESEGYTVLRADPIAKDLMQNDEGVRKKIIKAFGEHSYSNEKLNTKFLAENVFNNKTKLETINAIVHPPTIKVIEKRSEEILKKNNLVFIESALIYEAKIESMVDYILLVYSDEKTKIERTLNRDKISADQIKKRMQFQIPDENKKDIADFVIENNSTIEQLKLRTHFLLNILISLTK